MATISAASREAFEERSSVFRTKIKELFNEEKAVVSTIESEADQAPYKRIELVELMIYIVTQYITIHNLSVEILGVKNEDALNEGRKTLYKAIIYLEEIVTNIIDATTSDLEDKLETIKDLPVEKRYYIVRKLGLAVRLIMDAYGENTKWKWSFVELQGRFTTVAKNLLDMTQASKDYFDGRSPNHDVCAYYMRMLKKLLVKAAEGYREKYELSTRRSDDMRLGINYLLAYRRLLIILSDSEGAEETKKKAQVWKDKMEADVKKQKQQGK